MHNTRTYIHAHYTLLQFLSVNVVIKYDFRYHVYVVLKRHSRAYDDRSIVIRQFPSVELKLIILRIRVSVVYTVSGQTVVNSRTRLRSEGIYVMSAVVNLMIYTGRRKTNERIYLAQVQTYTRCD